MSKWSKRSDEEKKAIFEQQQKMQDEAERKKAKGTFAIFKDEDATKVYDNKEIPLPCLQCGWTGSEEYHKVKRPHPLTDQEIPYLEGKCRKCGSIVKRTFPIPYEPEGVIFLMTMQFLSQQGRLK
jgi:hypothetical protein